MKSLIDLILTIEERPAMSISKNYISCLKSFIDGWYLGSDENIKDIEVINEFQHWIEHKYRIKSSQSWADIIIFFSADEHDALFKFFSLFKEFLKVSPAVNPLHPSLGGLD